MSTTSDRNDPDLGHGVDTEPTDQNKKYLVLSEDERAKGFVRPYRDSYTHITCGASTRMAPAISETYARQPDFYGATYCVSCRKHLPLEEFSWNRDGETLGS